MWYSDWDIQKGMITYRVKCTFLAPIFAIPLEW